MDKIAEYLTTNIKNNVSDLTELQLIKIKFGLECLMSEASKMLIYLLLFSFFSFSAEFVTVLLFFTIIRAFAGGYHEKTYWRCFTTTLILISICMFVGMSFYITIKLRIILLIISVIIAYIYAPVDHPNKPIISKVRRKKFKYLSVIVFIILGLISLYLPDKYSAIAVMAILIESLTLIFGKLFNHEQHDEQMAV